MNKIMPVLKPAFSLQPIGMTYKAQRQNNSRILSYAALNLNMLKEMLRNKFENTEYKSAGKDVQNFIRDKDSLLIWPPSLFISILDDLAAAENS
ncbi:MAG: hypothetical protein IIZ48_06955 [Erysipelotrichales bacterium]|nr:hypothetical protein [Erysipelotrichales bacterium]